MSEGRKYDAKRRIKKKLEMIGNASLQVNEGIQAITLAVGWLIGQLDAETETEQQRHKNWVKRVTNSIREVTPMTNANDKGNIRLRKDGRYEARIYLNGKLKTIGYAKTMSECKKRLAEYNRQLRADILPQPGQKLRLFEWLDQWLELFKRPRQRESTFKKTGAVIRQIKKLFPDIELTKLDALLLQKDIYKIPQARKRQYVYILLKDAITRAWKTRLIPFNPFDAVDRPAYKAKCGGYLTAAQQELFMAEARRSSPYADMYEFYLQTGCRANEIYRVKWEHIDFTENRIFIDGTKTATSQRWLPMTKTLRALLERLPKKGHFLFKTSVETIRKDMDRIEKATGIPCTRKDFRHTFATRCHEAGVSPLVYSRWLGHSSTIMVETVYTHPEDSYQTEIAKLNGPTVPN